jgi:hypothetical protein
VSGFADDGWSLLSSEGSEDITISVKSSPNKLDGFHVITSPLFSAIGGGIMCAKASMLIQVGAYPQSSSFSVIYEPLTLLYCTSLHTVECAACSTCAIFEGASFSMG